MALIRRILGLLWPEQRVQAPLPAPAGGGYDIVIVQEGEPIVFDPPDASVGLVTSASVPVTVGDDGTRYVAAVRARSASGIAGEAAVQMIRLVADGGDLVARPNAPGIESVLALADGNVAVRWAHDDMYASADVASFQVFAGMEAVDYETPLATLGARDRRAVLTSLAAGVRWKVAVRAFSAGGVHDGNLASRIVVPRDDPPLGLEELTADQVPY